MTHPAKAMTKNCHKYGCMGPDSSRPSSPAGLLLDASTTCQHSASGVDRVLAHYGGTYPDVIWSKYSNTQRVSSLHLSKGCLNPPSRKVRSRERLGGLLRFYHREAARVF